MATAQYWMQKGGGATIDEAYDIALDTAGNTYTTGYFSSTATFGATTLVSSGSSDIFVVKTDDEGVIQWAVKAGGSGPDRGHAIDVDAWGNCYVTGYYNGTADFSGQTLTSAGLQDVFVAKYNPSGALQWVVSAGGPSSDLGNGIAIDPAGKPVVTGEFKDSASFGGTQLLSMNASTDVFITKLDTAGSFSWTQQGAGNNTDRGLDVDCDALGNIYATGQFSQNFTFDQTHNNAMFNVTYVARFDSTGQEQWFRIIGGGSANVANGLATRPNGDSYLTGDFIGDLTFFGPGNNTISSTYTNRIFICRYDSAGILLWAEADGSEDILSSRAIGVDGEGNAYITGYFKCFLDEYAAMYGSGTFNSVGFTDVFVSAYDSLGNWDFSRNAGGVREDYSYGLAVTPDGMMHIAGSFREEMHFPVSANFLTSNLANWDDDSCPVNNGYCGDSHYGAFYSYTSIGNSDVLIANAFDPAREPYDYYQRDGMGGGCQRDALTPCINPNCPDTLLFCQSPNLTAHLRQCSQVGQEFSYLWNNDASDTQQVATAIVPYQNELRIRTYDNCLFMYDTVVYLPHVPPLISDDKGINTDAIFPDEVEVCAPDSVTLTGDPYGFSSHSWTGPGLGGGIFDTVVTVTASGTYSFQYTDTAGCEHSNGIVIDFHDSLPDFNLQLNAPDTVTVCEGQPFELWLYDSVANPNANEICFNSLPYNVVTTWTISPTTFTLNVCESKFVITPQDSTTYTISNTVVRSNPCDTDTHFVSKSIFVRLNPAPPVPVLNLSLSGSNFYCPGDSGLLVATGAPNYSWTGTGVTGAVNDSVHVSAHDIYTVSSSVNDTNSYGCISTNYQEAQTCVSEKPQPILTASAPVLCPNDSVLLTMTHPLSGPPCYNAVLPDTFCTWFGPNGQLPGNSPSIYVTDPGSYYCVYDDPDSCSLISNTVAINQYTTPSLFITGNPVLCEGDSMTISLVTDTGSTIEWQSPLSGSALQQTVYEPGTYTCKITSCNIETFASIEILASGVAAGITASGPLCLNESTTLRGNPGMATYEWWPGGQTTDSIVTTTPGTFVLTTTDTNGCTAVSDSFTVTMDQVPTSVQLLGPQNFCSGDTIVLAGNDSMSSYHWLPGGAQSRTIQVAEPGTYVLTTIDTNGCEGVSAPVTVDTLPSHAPVAIEGNTVFCEGNFATLSALRTKGIVEYRWLPTGDSTRSIGVTQSGKYILTTIDTAGCTAMSDTVTVAVQPDDLPAPNVTDTVVCSGTSALLRAGETAGEVAWMHGNDTSNIFIGDVLQTEVIEGPVVYYVWQRLDHCESDPVAVVVEVMDCEGVEIPNVFTPNGDGINDIFRTRLNGNECFRCVIFNRWGMPVYEMNGFNPGWDGTLRDTGNPAPDGTYFYLVEYCRHDGEVLQFRGSVTLLRH